MSVRPMRFAKHISVMMELQEFRYHARIAYCRNRNAKGQRQKQGRLDLSKIVLHDALATGENPLLKSIGHGADFGGAIK